MEQEKLQDTLAEQLNVQREQLTTLKKIHFWVKFWSVLALISLCAGAVVGLLIVTEAL